MKFHDFQAILSVDIELNKSLTNVPIYKQIDCCKIDGIGTLGLNT